MLDIFVTKQLLNLLMISTTFSFILMAFIQKIKMLSIIKNNNQIFFINLFLAFTLGVIFSMTFYSLNWEESLWVSFFSFIGAPSIYQLLKNQKIINYTPKALTSHKVEKIEVPIENQILRNDL